MIQRLFLGHTEKLCQSQDMNHNLHSPNSEPYLQREASSYSCILFLMLFWGIYVTPAAFEGMEVLHNVMSSEQTKMCLAGGGGGVSILAQLDERKVWGNEGRPEKHPFSGFLRTWEPVQVDIWQEEKGPEEMYSMQMRDLFITGEGRHNSCNRGRAA